ncbi:MAG: hypothetical protein ACP5NW_04175 [Candidatus Woesearchaeota archaeon]
MEYAHLSAGFMLTSIVGFLISVFFVWNISMTWGFTFGLFFAATFIASIISMTKAEFSDTEIQEELHIGKKPRYSLKKKR